MVSSASGLLTLRPHESHDSNGNKWEWLTNNDIYVQIYGDGVYSVQYICFTNHHWSEYILYIREAVERLRQNQTKYIFLEDNKVPFYIHFLCLRLTCPLIISRILNCITLLSWFPKEITGNNNIFIGHYQNAINHSDVSDWYHIWLIACNTLCRQKT